MRTGSGLSTITPRFPLLSICIVFLGEAGWAIGRDTMEAEDDATTHDAAVDARVSPGKLRDFWEKDMGGSVGGCEDMLPEDRLRIVLEPSVNREDNESIPETFSGRAVVVHN